MANPRPLQPGHDRSGRIAAVCATSRTAAWLVGSNERQLSAADLFGELCRRLVEDGVPLHRASLALIASHPQVFARNVRWSRDGGVEVIIRPHDIVQSAAYTNSPVALILQGQPEVRRRLAGEAAELDFPIIRELSEKGATDYVALPLRFSNERLNFVSWATDRPGGFAEAELELLRGLLPLIGLRLELESAYFTMQTLLDVYLGKGAGRQVMAGTVRRAQGKVIRAAIWYSDLRDFTAMAGRLPAAEVIATLDDYFDCVVGAVHGHNGDVLKFIGDGMLAIFTGEGDAGERSSCSRAMDAAGAALQRLAQLNRQRATVGKEPLRGGIALHMGEVTYGNIGSRDRLDFTVIGPAINLVSRMEPMCNALNQPVVVSEAFSQCAGAQGFVPLGAHGLRGFSRPQALFAPPPGRLDPRHRSEEATPAP